MYAQRPKLDYKKINFSINHINGFFADFRTILKKIHSLKKCPLWEPNHAKTESNNNKCNITKEQRIINI